MTPTFRTSGNSRSWQLHSGSKAQSSLGGAFEIPRLRKRDWLMIAATLVVVSYTFLSAASPARPDAQQPTAFGARAGGKVSR